MRLPRIDYARRPPGARELVLVAHGGQETSLDPAHGRRPALLRMWSFVAAARQAAPKAAVGLVRYRYRGWNDADAHALADVATLLDRLPDSVERVALVGHSMGGRAVVGAGTHPAVAGVLALAPWLPADEPLRTLAGRQVVLAHGDLDRLTDPRLTVAYARRLRAAGVPVALLRAEGEAHALLERPGDWDELVRRFVAGAVGPGPVDAFLASTTSTDPARPPDPLPRWSRSRGRSAAVLGIARARAAGLLPQRSRP